MTKFKAWLSEWYNGLFHPFDDVPLGAFRTDEEFLKMFAATKEEEWEDE